MTHTIHRIKDGFVNLYLIEEPGKLNLIDTGYAKSGPRAVLAALKTLGHNPRDLHHILITHADGDHTGGAAALSMATGAQIVASAIEAKAIARGKSSRAYRGHPLVQRLITVMAGAMPPVMVNQIIEAQATFPVLGGLIAIASPGHTPGHLAYFSESTGTLFAGDALLSSRGKLVFLNAPVQWDYHAGVSSATTLRALNAKTVYCGHGAPISLA